MSTQTAISKERKLWSEWEDRILRNEVSRQSNTGHMKNWRDIAAKIPDRSNKDCRKRWMKLDDSITKGPWSEQEDEALRVAVQQYSHAWAEVARLVKSRNPDQCAKRWLHYLNPELDHSEWTETDDRRLLAAVDEHGHNWKRITESSLVGRSATDAKNRYSILTRNGRKNKTLQDLEAPRVRRRRVISSTLRSTSDAMPSETQQYAVGKDEGLLDQKHEDNHSAFEDHGLDFESSLNNMHNFSTSSEPEIDSDRLTGQHSFQLPACFDPFLSPVADEVSPVQPFVDEYFGHDIPLRYSSSKPSCTGRSRTGIHTQPTFGASSTPSRIGDSSLYAVGTPLSLSPGASPVCIHDDPDTPNKQDVEDTSYHEFKGFDETSTSNNAQDLTGGATGRTEEKASAPGLNGLGRRKTMVLQNISPELARQVLDMVFSSGSEVTIKISDE